MDVVEAVDQIGDGGLARAGSADKGDLLTGHGVHGDIVENLLFVRVAEIHTIEGHAAFHLTVGDGAVGPVGVLPGP